MSREMRHSGIEWIGEIPKEWNCQRLKFLCSIQTGNQDTQDANSEGEYPFYVRSPLVERSSKYSFDGEGILMAGDGVGAGRVFHHAFGKYAVHQRVYRLSSFTNIVPNYLFNYISNLFTRVMDMGSAQSTVPSVRLPMLSNFTVCIPPLSEQQKIANYLDKVCGEVDEMIALQEQMIEELKAYKQSVITEAVTKGLNPNAPMRDSGIDWIGEIPENWKVIRIKYLLKERKERSDTGLEEPLSMSQKYGLIPTKEMDAIPNIASSFVGAKLVYRHDLVFNKLKAHLGVFAESDYDGLVSPDYAVYYSSGLVDVKYLEYLFKSPQYIAEFIKLSTGVGAGLTRLYTSDLYSIYGIVPPIEIQREIVDYIRQLSSEINALIAIKQSKIDELKEYKKSVIYEYVTGKKEVV